MRLRSILQKIPRAIRNTPLVKSREMVLHIRLVSTCLARNPIGTSVFELTKDEMSILLGVTQMMVGIFMSFLNQLKDGDWLSVYCEFIPQVVFLGGLFGYLSFLIVLKWITPGCTADLYHAMIYMFLAPGNAWTAWAKDREGCGCPENKMFPGQGGLQLLILFACFVSVPIMLFPKPIILKRRHEQKRRGGMYVRLDDGDGDGTQQVNSSEELRSSVKIAVIITIATTITAMAMKSLILVTF